MGNNLDRKISQKLTCVYGSQLKNLQTGRKWIYHAVEHLSFFTLCAKTVLRMPWLKKNIDDKLSVDNFSTV